MPRTKIIPDTTVFATITSLLAKGGEKAVSFSTVARATGLAAPTLVQRFGSRDAMVKAARLAIWDTVDDATAAAIDASADKGPQGLLKAMDSLGAPLPDAWDDDLQRRAARWRATVESALAMRFGGGEKGREAAGMLFAAWQGQRAWHLAGGKAFRLKDVAKRFT